jgi:hypothetical protein
VAVAKYVEAASVQVLVSLGGWRAPQTILKCYQRADPITMKRALATRMRLEA